MKCVFGDWDCSVSERLEEMQKEIVSAMKTDVDPKMDKIFQQYMGKMLSIFGSPLVSLAHFCQACPIVKYHYKEAGIE